MRRILSILTILVPAVFTLFLFSSCRDEFETIGSGECVARFNVEFKAPSPALDSWSRSVPGDAISGIDTLWVLLYDGQGNLADSCQLTKKDFISHTASSAAFSFKVPYGIYNAYAAANVGNIENYTEQISTEEGLKNISLTWDSKNIDANRQMFGQFKTKDGQSGPVVINEKSMELHANLRRAASKVTVAFDGSMLEEGVFIYIESVQIMDIPKTCLLGNPNTVTSNDGLINGGDTIAYAAPGTPYDENYPLWISRGQPYYPHGGDPSQKPEDKISHPENGKSLFFFENMQGEGKDKAQDKDHMGDASPVKDDKPYGTYIEVSGYYRSIHHENVGNGPIKYRFMLGKNITTNYDAERNHHYKLTLRFNRFANDPDWHIEYKKEVQILEVTQPKDVNYQGKVFLPNTDVPNLGHTFNNENKITVSSYITYENDDTYRRYVDWSVSYREEGETEFSSSCEWLQCNFDKNSDSPVKEVTFTVDSDFEEFTIDDKLKTAKEEGTSGAPYDLSNPGGSGTTNTANCYMIAAPGWYMFPLVYGNAIQGGATNMDSYRKYAGNTEDNILPVFKNHLGNDITTPYINQNTGCTAKSAYLVWEDEKNLVTNIEYIPGAYGNMGGVKFHVSQANIKQGNAVIAVKDNSERVMWSWHIWVTRFDFEKNITVTGHGSLGKFELMPVNLGWCSGHDDKIRYYKGRECEVKFTAGDMEKTVTIRQYPHTAFPLGNNTYYQWGRKDPFIGTNANWANKERYDAAGNPISGNPPRLYDDSAGADDTKRKPTREILHLLIQKPDTWHNPPRDTTGGNPYVSNNKTYANLWGCKDAGIPVKTVYDPCPVGYQVCHYNAFTGFTVTGDNTSAANERYDVIDDNIPEALRNDALYEFYTNTTKLQSIIFPMTGYRDWDSYAGIYQYGPIIDHDPIGASWSAVNKSDNSSYFLKFKRGVFIRPNDSYYSCDGFPVRPCAISTGPDMTAYNVW